MTLPERVSIVEVAPRDGLQNEATTVALATKVALIEQLAAAGLVRIEAGSFVSPKWVPQMADTAAVLAALHIDAPVELSVLVPNVKGLEGALAARVPEVAVFAAASETFSKRNINCSVDESLDRFTPVVQRARAAGVRVRGYVSCALGCPYEGAVEPDAVASVARCLIEMGCFEVSLGDTIGVGTPIAARRLVERVAEDVKLRQIAVHFHDTYGQALANILACLELGVSVIDSAVAGLGGCPYAKGATGNVATEDVVYMLHGMGIETGLDLDRLCAAGNAISAVLGRPTQSRVATARRQGAGNSTSERPASR